MLRGRRRAFFVLLALRVGMAIAISGPDFVKRPADNKNKHSYAWYNLLKRIGTPITTSGKLFQSIQIRYQKLFRCSVAQVSREWRTSTRCTHMYTYLYVYNNVQFNSNKDS